MAQTDPPTNDGKKRASPLAGCAVSTIAFAFLVLGILFVATLGMCAGTASATALLFLSIVGGLSLLIATALLDAALYYWGSSSGRFGKAMLPIAALVILLSSAWFATIRGVSLPTRLEAGLLAIALAVAFVFIALRIKPRSRNR